MSCAQRTRNATSVDPNHSICQEERIPWQYPYTSNPSNIRGSYPAAPAPPRRRARSNSVVSSTSIVNRQIICLGDRHRWEQLDGDAQFICTPQCGHDRRAP